MELKSVINMTIRNMRSNYKIHSGTVKSGDPGVLRYSALIIELFQESRNMTFKNVVVSKLSRAVCGYRRTEDL
jgi:hypothetical protein